MRHSRSSVPKVANSRPAVDEGEIAEQPCGPMRGDRLAADHREPGDDDRGADHARSAGSFSLSTTVASASPPSAAQDGWITPPWRERHQQETGIAEQRERRPAERASAAAPLPQPMPPRSRRPSRATSGRNTSPAQTKR